MSNRIRIKIYYEDTDAAGVVYYANYLRYLERARTELLSGYGINVTEYHNMGCFFAITHVDIYYKRPAKLGDFIEVTTDVTELKNATITLKHQIFRDSTLLVAAFVTIACIGKDNKPRRLPEIFKNIKSDAG